jgi:hypothetical protein
VLLSCHLAGSWRAWLLPVHLHAACRRDTANEGKWQDGSLFIVVHYRSMLLDKHNTTHVTTQVLAAKSTKTCKATLLLQAAYVIKQQSSDSAPTCPQMPPLLLPPVEGQPAAAAPPCVAARPARAAAAALPSGGSQTAAPEWAPQPCKE